MAGFDYDLQACIDYNPQTFTYDEVREVLANIEGEHDGADYHWILRLEGGRWAYLYGGCDYTGWDCQSWAESILAGSRDSLIRRMESEKIDLEVIRTLNQQISAGRTPTWREEKDAELGVVSGSEITYG